MTTSLVIRGAEATTVFSLLGGDENAASYALGWTLSRSDALLGALLDRLGMQLPIGNVRIKLQRHGADRDPGRAKLWRTFKRLTEIRQSPSSGAERQSKPSNLISHPFEKKRCPAQARLAAVGRDHARTGPTQVGLRNSIAMILPVESVKTLSRRLALSNFSCTDIDCVTTEIFRNLANFPVKRLRKSAGAIR